MLKAEKKTKIIKEHKIHDTDTGSSQVQIALLNEEIDELALHLKKHPKDFSSKRGLLKMVAKRRKLLNLLKEKEPKKYESLTKKIKA